MRHVDSLQEMQKDRKEEQSMSDRKKRTKNSGGVMAMNKSKWKFVLLIAVPTFLLYLYICIVPMINSIANSVFEWNGYGPKKWVGFENYINIFKDPDFMEAFFNDVIIVFFKEIIIVVLSVIFAVSLTRARLKKSEISFFRFLFYIPNILSIIVISMVWKYFFESIGDKIGLFATENGIWTDHPLPLIIFIASWCGIGYYMIILITSINNIPKQLYEAASLDGAGEIKQLIHIILPEVRPQIRYVIINVLSGSLAVNMNLILPLTGGANHTGVMGLYVYNYGPGSQTPMVGYAYAAAVVLMGISFILCFTVNMYMKRKEAKD